jgi:[protein-PII] uridylyltransferase
VLYVVTRDRVGVLFAITHALHRLGVVNHLAKITTQAHQVLDVFYVTDAEGRKITDPERLHTVCDQIVAELQALTAA